MKCTVIRVSKAGAAHRTPHALPFGELCDGPEAIGAMAAPLRPAPLRVREKPSQSSEQTCTKYLVCKNQRDSWGMLMKVKNENEG